MHSYLGAWVNVLRVIYFSVVSFHLGMFWLLYKWGRTVYATLTLGVKIYSTDLKFLMWL